jgi:tRNA threonylcarbamoyladenosine biosynthesis protein TsaE
MSQSRPKSLIFEKTSNLSSLEKIAKLISAEIIKEDRFCLWLDADMGAGKTTLTRYILRELGLDEKTPVTSPTYTYLNEYKINGKWIAHLDLYRMNGGDDLYELGLSETRPFSGYIVEWPEAVEDPDPLHPTHILNIQALEPSLRSYKFYKT